jgi:hypothetical protein
MLEVVGDSVTLSSIVLMCGHDKAFCCHDLKS